MLFLAIPLMTVQEVIAGVSLTPPEVMGPIGGFVILGLFAVWVMVALLRKMPSWAAVASEELREKGLAERREAEASVSAS